MEPITQITAVAAPLLRPNIDTDAIIPSREMKRVSKRGLAEGLFAGWRYQSPDSRKEKPDFILNQDPFRKAQILLGGNNFGCGSSREHAVWALHEWGIRAIIAPSFGAIFHGNCVRNGILPIRLPDPDIQALSQWVTRSPKEHIVHIDLAAQTVDATGYNRWPFDIEAQDKQMLLEGLDAIDMTLTQQAEIARFEAEDEPLRPWIYACPRPDDEVT